jgi:hypothetical protein
MSHDGGGGATLTRLGRAVRAADGTSTAQVPHREEHRGVWQA